MSFLSCDECHACCDGLLIGSAHGISFGNNVPCSFLCKDSCTIYDIRPDMCKNYQCAWSQNLFTTELKPTISNLLISVETKPSGCLFPGQTAYLIAELSETPQIVKGTGAVVEPPVFNGCGDGSNKIGGVIRFLTN